MPQTLNHAFSPPKQIGSPQDRNGVRSSTQMLRSSATVFISLGNGPVPAITGNLSIYSHKMHIRHDNGFLQLSCLKDTPLPQPSYSPPPEGVPRPSQARGCVCPS